MWAVRPLVLIVLAWAAIGCTRKAPEHTSVRLNFAGSGQGKIGAASVVIYKDIIINVTGSGMPTRFIPLHSRNGDNCDASASLPTSIEIPDVPTETELRVQVLAIISEDCGPGHFYYGISPAKKFTGAENTVPIELTLKDDVNVGDATIAGRYVETGATPSPTGRIRVFYQPDDPSDPKMLVDDKNEMFAGWFRVFAIKGAKLEYVMPNGKNLFGTAMGIDDFTPSDSIVKISTPEYYYTRGSNSGTRSKGHPSSSLYGFFGPNASGKPVCYNDADVTLSNNYRASTGGALIHWMGATVTAGDAYVEDGGTDTCPASSPFVDYIKLMEKQVLSHDQALGFKGPFQVDTTVNTGGWDVLVTTVDSNDQKINVKWTYLPGVQTSTYTQTKGIDGAELFIRAETSQNNSNDDSADYKSQNDGYRCGELTTLPNRFYSLKKVTANADATSLVVVVTGPPPLAVDSGDISYSALAAGDEQAKLNAAIPGGSYTLLACPYAMVNGKQVFFNSAAVKRPSGGFMPVGNTFAIKGPYLGSSATNPVRMANNVCTHFSARALLGSIPAMFPQTKSLTFTADNSSTLKFYQDSGCGTEITSAYSNFGGDILDFYVKTLDSGAASHSFTVVGTGSGFGGTNTVLTSSADEPGTPAYPQLVIQSPSSIVAHTCYPITYEKWNADPIASLRTPLSLSGITDPWHATGTGLQFYMDGYCSSGASSHIFMNSNATFARMSFKYTSTASFIDLSPTSLGTAVAIGTTSVNVTQPGAISRVWMYTQNSATTGSCQQIEVSFMDDQGHASPVGSGATLTLSGGTGDFYAYSGCSSGLISGSASLNAGDTGMRLYYQPTADGDHTLSVTLDSPNISSEDQTVHVEDPVPAYVQVVWQGDQSFSGGGLYPFPSSAPTGVQGGSYTLEFYVLDASYNLISNFNESSVMTNYSGGNNFGPVGSSTLNFVNGVATLGVTVGAYATVNMSGDFEFSASTVNFSTSRNLNP